MDINIKVTFDNEAVKAINGLTEVLKGLTGIMPNAQTITTVNLTPPAEKSIGEPLPAGTPQAQTTPDVAVTPQTSPATAPIPMAAVTYSRADLANGARTLMDAQRTTELQGLLQKYTVASLADLPESNFAMFAADLRLLGVNI